MKKRINVVKGQFTLKLQRRAAAGGAFSLRKTFSMLNIMILNWFDHVKLSRAQIGFSVFNVG